MSDHNQTAAKIRRLTPAEWEAASPIVSQLHTLDEGEFLKRVRRQSCSGYELVGAFKGGRLIGVLGMKPVQTLARGMHLQVDDLVVDSGMRGSGAGHALMTHIEADARARGMSAVFLNARREAIPFYERENYVFHSAPSMKKIP